MRPAAAVPPIRLALVDDQHEVRTSWQQLIGSFPDLCCVSVCASGQEAIKTLPKLQPDVVLMDIYMPGMSGVECTTLLRPLIPHSRILILSEVEDDDVVFRALQAGADGYLLKRIKPADLRTAVVDVTQGGAPMTSQIARRVVELFHRRPRSPLETVRLTPREEETLMLLSQGHSNKEIADKLLVGIETIRTHLKKVYEKMHVRSRSEAVAHYVASREFPKERRGP